MHDCDLLKAVERAAFEYLARLIANRLGKLLGKRLLAALMALIAGILVDGPSPIGDIIGLLIAIGIGIWSVYDAYKLITELIEQFRNGMWQAFKNLPSRLLDAGLLDCLNRKPECCALFQREVGKMLRDAIRGLRPGWKKRSPMAGGARWSRLVKDIKARLAGPLGECCA